MTNTNWHDLYRDGRRLETIIKSMHTKAKSAKNPILQLAYIDRIIKATHEKVEIAKIVLKVDEVLKAKPINDNTQLHLVEIPRTGRTSSPKATE